MKLTSPVRVTLIALVTALVALSCNNSFGSFASIKKEVAQSKSSDFKQTTVVDFVKAAGGGFGATGTYYAVMSAVYYRPASGGSWKTVSLPGVGSSYSCSGVAFDITNHRLYIAAISDSDNSCHIFYSDDGTWNAANIVDLTAMGLTVGGSRYDRVSGLWCASDGTLFAQAEYFKTTGTTITPYVAYTLFSADIGDPLAQVDSALPHSNSPTGMSATYYVGVAFDGSFYYAAAYDPATKTSMVYHSGSIDFSGGGSYALGGANAVAAGMKWMTLTGKLYAWTTTTIYTLGAGAATSIGSPSLSTDNVITDVQEAPVSPTTYHLLVGTGTTNVSYTANGYFESSNTAPTYSYHAGDSGSIAPSGSNSTYSTLFASKPVVKFFFDDAGGGTGTLFACIAASGLTTSNYGLVSIDATAGSWNLSDGWSAE